MEQRERSRRRWVVAVVVLVALLVGGGVLLWPEEKKAALSPPPQPSVSSSPAPSPSKVLPYPYFLPGTCFDHPQLSTVITKAEARPCEAEHDGEAIANVLLPEGLTDDAQIGRALREACKAPLAEWDKRQGGGGPYYGFPLGPYLQYYQQGMREATCTMTVSNRQGGRKLTGHLH
ncbi:hypothetical protein GCM10010193_03200 [Kitasatospora atroaurantiaca]|uniref:Regulator of septum formation n=1 Tax=Kitasatospora atroaurantiaca TaxID=285545 RepID=A0A561ELU6_9ACTN|nr:hypothetical protein [Kitasatospora atroaurantiaca]TWE16539.1 hypothetical protein FB465_1522 [Kitasatospora atroaurantiaca]